MCAWSLNVLDEDRALLHSEGMEWLDFGPGSVLVTLYIETEIY